MAKEKKNTVQKVRRFEETLKGQEILSNSNKKVPDVPVIKDEPIEEDIPIKKNIKRDKKKNKDKKKRKE